MPLVTDDRYRAITGDPTSSVPDVAEWIDDATERLADALDRPLDEAERTERMFPTRDGSLWPHAVPVVAVPDGYTIDGYRIYIGWPNVGSTFPAARPGVEVTYTGGWVERTANPDAINRLPTCIEEDIAIAAYLIGHPTPLAGQVAVPVGARSVSLGDASISFGANGALTPRPVRITWTSKTLGYRYLRIGGEPC